MIRGLCALKKLIKVQEIMTFRRVDLTLVLALIRYFGLIVFILY